MPTIQDVNKKYGAMFCFIHERLESAQAALMELEKRILNTEENEPNNPGCGDDDQE